MSHSADVLAYQYEHAVSLCNSYITAGAGNVLWHCINMLTPKTIQGVKSRSGVQAIAILHPHFYAGMAAWAEVIDDPIYVHARDKQ